MYSSWTLFTASFDLIASVINSFSLTDCVCIALTPYTIRFYLVNGTFFAIVCTYWKPFSSILFCFWFDCSTTIRRSQLHFIVIFIIRDTLRYTLWLSHLYKSISKREFSLIDRCSMYYTFFLNGRSIYTYPFKGWENSKIIRKNNQKDKCL